MLILFFVLLEISLSRIKLDHESVLDHVFMLGIKGHSKNLFWTLCGGEGGVWPKFTKNVTGERGSTVLTHSKYGLSTHVFVVLPHTFFFCSIFKVGGRNFSFFFKSTFYHIFSMVIIHNFYGKNTQK